MAEKKNKKKPKICFCVQNQKINAEVEKNLIVSKKKRLLKSEKKVIFLAQFRFNTYSKEIQLNFFSDN